MAQAIVGKGPKETATQHATSTTSRHFGRSSGFASLLAPLNHILPARESSATPQLRPNGQAKRQM